MGDAMQRRFTKVKALENAASNLLKSIEKVAQEFAPCKPSWMGIHAFKQATFKSQFKPIFDAEWQKESADKKVQPGARLIAYDKFIWAQFQQLSADEVQFYEAEAEAMNAEKSAKSRFCFVYMMSADWMDSTVTETKSPQRSSTISSFWSVKGCTKYPSVQQRFWWVSTLKQVKFWHAGKLDCTV